MSGPGYYVSATDGEARWLVSGPYPTHRAALDAVDEVRLDASLDNGPNRSTLNRSWMYAWGTAKRGVPGNVCDCSPPCLSAKETKLLQAAESGAVLPKTGAGRRALSALRKSGLVRKARVFVLTAKGRERLAGAAK